MLVLSRKLNQEIRIGENIVVRIVGIKGSQVRLGITAPNEVAVLREEVVTRARPANNQPSLDRKVIKGARC